MAGEKQGDADTAARILDIAERLAQTRGFNGFSYADIAEELGLTKASLHYHFRGKGELGEALISRYAARFVAALQEIDGSGEEAPAKLAAYAAIYADVLKEHRMCLCGMLAADYETLPEPMRVAVVDFFDRNEVWLANLLEQGRADGSLHPNGSVEEAAQAIVSGLEGAMLVARPHDDFARFQRAADRLIGNLVDAHPQGPDSAA